MPISHHATRSGSQRTTWADTWVVSGSGDSCSQLEGIVALGLQRRVAEVGVGANRGLTIDTAIANGYVVTAPNNPITSLNLP